MRDILISIKNRSNSSGKPYKHKGYRPFRSAQMLGAARLAPRRPRMGLVSGAPWMAERPTDVYIETYTSKQTQSQERRS